MAKRVLGDDPFAAPKPETGEPAAAPARPSRAPRTTARPATAAGTSTAPRARTSTAPKGRRSVAPGRTAPPADVTVPRASRVPQEAADLAALDALRAAPEPPSPAVPEVPPTVMATVPDEDEEHGTADAPPDVARPEPPPEPDVVEAYTAAPTTMGATAEGDLDLESAIRDVEAGIDRLLRASRGTGTEPGAPQTVIDRVADRLRAVTAARAEATPGSTTDDGAPSETARELLSSEYYLRQWGRVAMRDRTEEVDEFGLDPTYESRWRPLMDFLYDRWWRVDVEGIEHVPATGPVAIVANHSGALPYDGLMLHTALRKEHPARRPLRWLAEDFVFHFPFVGVHMNRLGAVRACQENAERLLRRGACVGLFPEGIKGVAKLYRDRYRLQRFGRGGHIKLAIRTGTPIVPVTIVGAEETHPMVVPSGLIAKALGVPYVPITPTFPLLGPLGLLPLPSKWRILFGEPLAMDGYGQDAADDEVLVGRLNEKLRTTIQNTLDSALRTRRSVFKG